MFLYRDFSVELTDSSTSLWARPPNGAKLTGSTGKSKAQVSSKAVVLKVQGVGVRRIYLPLDPLLAVCTFLTSGLSAGSAKIPHHVCLARSKADGPPAVNFSNIQA